MKKIIAIMFACVLSVTLTVPAYAYNYGFESGPDSKTAFGKETSTDEPVSPDPMSVNIRRNKDAAHLPPPYFYGSGDIPTAPSSMYHDNTLPGAGSGYNAGGGADTTHLIMRRQPPQAAALRPHSPRKSLDLKRQPQL